jgi:hypothetical protein
MSRALPRHDRTGPSRAPAPFACYTAPQLSPRQTKRPRVRCPCEPPGKRRDGDRLRKPKMMQPGTTVETSDDVRAAQLVERMLDQAFAMWLRRRVAVRESQLPRGLTRRDPNDPDSRQQPDALCSSSWPRLRSKCPNTPKGAICPAPRGSTAPRAKMKCLNLPG